MLETVASLEVSSDILNPDYTLSSGQAFRWKQVACDEWLGTLSPSGACICVTSRKDTKVQVLTDSTERALEMAHSYFRLDDDPKPELRAWSSGHGEEIARAIAHFPGLRLLRQDPVECLFSFMTSAAAPIVRIRRCMDGLSCTYGDRCLSPFGDTELYRFPTVGQLVQIAREEFDRLGFGFRGGHIRFAAQQVQDNGGEKWLRDLRNASYADAKRELMTLRGVGEKIADCVCLFSLDKDEAVPIDVHMERIAGRIFGDSIGKLSAKDGYARISDAYRDRFGAKAGWAQQYLYYAEIVANGLWDENLGKHRPGRRRP